MWRPGIEPGSPRSKITLVTIGYQMFLLFFWYLGSFIFHLYFFSTRHVSRPRHASMPLHVRFAGNLTCGVPRQHVVPRPLRWKFNQKYLWGWKRVSNTRPHIFSGQVLPLRWLVVGDVAVNLFCFVPYWPNISVKIHDIAPRLPVAIPQIFLSNVGFQRDLRMT
jgi:hypothetical protein